MSRPVHVGLGRLYGGFVFRRGLLLAARAPVMRTEAQSLEGFVI